MASVDIKRKSEELCNVYSPQLTVTILGVAINLFKAYSMYHDASLGTIS